MTTSGTTAYDRTGAEIIDAALRVIRVLGEDETVTGSSAQENNALVALNQMVKSDQMKLGLWRTQEARLFLIDGTASYSLPGANAADVSGLSETTTDADEASGQTVISVTATSGFANSDIIGIVQDDDTIHWSAIASFVTNDTVTIDDATTAAAASGNAVYVYTTAMPRPLKILSMRRVNNGNEIEVFQLSRDAYFSLSNKSSSGTPVEFFYDPQQGVGKVYLWPVPDTVADVINITYLDELEVFTAAATANYPQEWIEYLVYGLAMRLAAMNGVSMPNEALAIYQNSVSELEQWDSEDASVTFVSATRDDYG